MTSGSGNHSPRARARRGDGARLREEILAAATELLLETGDESAVSVRAVAKRVGVTPPSIYLHFGDKGELIFECCRALLGRLQHEVLDGTAHVEDPVARLRVAAHAFVRFGIDNPEPYRIMFMSPHHDAPRKGSGGQAGGQSGLDGGESRLGYVPAGFDVEEYEGLIAFRALVDMVAAVLGSEADEHAALFAMGLFTAVHGIASLMIAKAIEPIAFPWPDVDVLIDHVLNVHIEALASRLSGAPR